jgi:GNAT superfamily N-acetyltransferase
MKIRKANKFDLPKLKQMLWNYHDCGNIKGLDITSEETGLRILSMILAGGGVALVSEKDDELTGMLLAVRSPFLWDNSKTIMTEIAYWVEPEHRGSSAGYRLLKEYVEYCDELKDLNKICNYTISQMEGQELNYSRFGFKPIEHTWSI